MATRIKDLAVKTGEYTDKNGEKKGRYENIGSIWEGDRGQFIMLKSTFNPAGVERQPGKDSIMVSVFDIRDDKQSGQTAPRQQRAAPQQSAPQFEDDESLPF